jgi:hypothetical protein
VYIEKNNKFTRLKDGGWKHFWELFTIRKISFNIINNIKNRFCR